MDIYFIYMCPIGKHTHIIKGNGHSVKYPFLYWPYQKIAKNKTVILILRYVLTMYYLRFAKSFSNYSSKTVILGLYFLRFYQSARFNRTLTDLHLEYIIYDHLIQYIVQFCTYFFDNFGQQRIEINDYI